MQALELLYNIFCEHGAVTTDTRNIKPGDIFFALKGPNFNGNQFAQQALAQGARLAVIDEQEYYLPDNMLLVTNVLETLQALAKHHRQQLQIPVIAITGSNGKTTTKELVHAVLATKYRTSTTAGNLNNHIGIPLTLLRIPNTAQMAVVEMGANHQKEIENYCSCTLPTAGMITNCGKAHLEGFGGVEGVRKGKGELFEHLRGNAGQAFICSDFDYFESMSQGLTNPIWYGTENGSVVGQVVESSPFLKVKLTCVPNGEIGAMVCTLTTQLVGQYNVYNVLAAVTIGLHFGVPLADIAQAIGNYCPTNSRSQLLHKGGNTIILDAYNANPTSMAAAIENFAETPYPDKMLFLGGMMELGDQSPSEHLAIVRLLQKFKWKDVVLVGEQFKAIAHEYRFFNTVEEACLWWAQNFKTGQTLLVKGSRSMKMEKVLDV
ncbi:MAG: UDP-N-acetylmuramoyl-tripeptide--D-alanyl-D-alanine ligase [Bacteroidetes bacterium]|nr:MAG: UDP-N-acetylmuramoyl-tripeptide--D-alanyl-D-alanine ligase [Bacteroidota bacterium]